MLRALMCVCLPASTAWVHVASPGIFRVARFLPRLPRPGSRSVQACASAAAASTTPVVATTPVVLEREDWTARAEAHRMRVLAMLKDGMVAGYAKPDGSQFGGLDPGNPIFNFLLNYYNIRRAPQQNAASLDDPCGFLFSPAFRVCSFASFPGRQRWVNWGPLAEGGRARNGWRAGHPAWTWCCATPIKHATWTTATGFDPEPSTLNPIPFTLHPEP